MQADDGTVLAHDDKGRAPVSAGEVAQVDVAPFADPGEVSAVAGALGTAFVHGRDRVGVLGAAQPDPDGGVACDRFDPAEILGVALHAGDRRCQAQQR